MPKQWHPRRRSEGPAEHSGAPLRSSLDTVDNAAAYGYDDI
jgi:hypothetical protein